MEELPPTPPQALDEEELVRFLHTCAFERRSPTTKRNIDPHSYRWIHDFITHWESGQGGYDTGWAELRGAEAVQIKDFFARVSARLHDRPSGEYARQLSRFYTELEAALDDWPGSPA